MCRRLTCNRIDIHARAFWLHYGREVKGKHQHENDKILSFTLEKESESENFGQIFRFFSFRQFVFSMHAQIQLVRQKGIKKFS